MREGLNMIRCLADASPIVYGFSRQRDKILWMDRVYTSTVFGALDRFENPIANLMATAKRAATMQSDPFTTMIVPSGLMELQRYAKAENVFYYLSGQAKDRMEPVKFGLDGGLHDPATNLNIFVHYPKVDYAAGTAYGKAQSSGLSEDVRIKVFYPPKTGDEAGNAYFMDAVTGEAKSTGVKGTYVEYKCLMSSAILAAGGSKTGELLMAYPQTSVNTIATAPEMMKLQLRVYLGACLYNPQNVMIIPHCHFEGIQYANGTYDNSSTPVAEGTEPPTSFPVIDDKDQVPENEDDFDNDDRARTACITYQGATWNDKHFKEQNTKNNGHFGNLDCPAGYNKLHGHNVLESGLSHRMD